MLNERARYSLKVELTDPKARVVGRKQVLRALSKGEAVEVLLAKDGDSSIAREMREAAAKASVAVVEAESMASLGRACGIEVGASVAAIIRIEP
jgi:large subunit ribosomal protein L7A